MVSRQKTATACKLDYKVGVNDNDWMKKWRWKRGAGCVVLPFLLSALVLLSI